MTIYQGFPAGWKVEKTRMNDGSLEYKVLYGSQLYGSVTIPTASEDDHDYLQACVNNLQLIAQRQAHEWAKQQTKRDKDSDTGEAFENDAE